MLVTALLLVGIAESEQYVVRGSVTASPHPYDSDSSDRLHFLATNLKSPLCSGFM